MCGIAGLWCPPSIFEADAHLEAMLQEMIHRGPDSSGKACFPEAPGMLGHRRLSIIDPEGGDQPLFNEDRTKAIVTNGEIYNHPQLRPWLEQKGHMFRTDSDAETALHLYEELGPEIVSKIDGMYSLAIADGQTLFLARDPLGIKPLYYARQGESIYFASELKALSRIPGIASHITEFPPGTAWHTKSGWKTFYEVPHKKIKHDSLAQMTEKLQQLMEKVVEKRLMSDVPLGVFLSGGLDSSIIAALARRLTGKPLHSFSVGVEGCADLEAARKLSRFLDTTHHEHIITIDEVIAKLPEIIYSLESYDQDLVRSAIPTYFTARLARQHVKVVLSGEGADELFAGYTYYKNVPQPESLLHEELRRSLASLHNINLQRVDRLTMTHSIEGRVPFLDLEIIDYSMEIPIEWKLRGNPPVEKWILRKAFADMLPDEITWRKKEQFDEGSGTVEIVGEAVASQMSAAEADKHCARYPEANLRSPEECYYHKLFLGLFQNSPALLDNVGHWAERPDWGEV